MYTNMEKTKEGYYRYSKIPKPEDLKSFYEEYYPKEQDDSDQKTHGNYKINYADDEMIHMNNEFEKIYFIDNKSNKKEKKSLLDIGCGEGYALKFFEEKGYDIVGLDFNGYACKLHNENVSDKVRVGDFYETTEQLIKEGKKFDLIVSTNVLEHVVDPKELMEKAFKLLNKNGIFIVRVPNDFSVLQKYLWDKKSIEKPYWVAIPDHLNYFSLESLQNLGNNLGLTTVDYYTDFPIDINLLNENTNYIKNDKVGKSCFKSKIELENLISSISLEKTINLGRSFADLGIGRNVTMFYKKVD